jgi:hypothetical protein
MRIKRLVLTIEPEYPHEDLTALKWKIEDGYREFDYTHTLWSRESLVANDFKSMWDHLWEKAKFEIEREVLKDPVGKVSDGKRG